MSTLREVLQQALKALEVLTDTYDDNAVGIEIDAIHALRAALAEHTPKQEVQEPVAWGAFYFGGNRNGKLYSHCDTQAQIEAYIANHHQSDDSNTFRAAPLYTAPPQRHPHRTVTYVCPVCAASLERQE
jgi:hypothetical protein